jgi:hypothetical protein
VLVDEVAEVVSLLALPLAGAALHLSEFHGAEALVVAVVPLKDVLDACGLMVILGLFPSEMWLELGEILLDQVKLNHMLRPRLIQLL